MCGRPGGFLGNILAEIAYSFAMPGYGYASRPQASIGFSFSWVVFCRYKFIPTNTLKSRCILPTLYGDSVIKLNKDSIFGYRDKKNTCYRFYNKVAYKIINPSEKILLYSTTSLEGIPRNRHNVTNYFFSANPDSPLYALSKWNLKTVLYNEVLFHELLDVYFESDKELIAYDRMNNVYLLNRIYELSKQKLTQLN